MRTTIPKTGNQSARGSYGPRLHPPQVTGSRQNHPMVEKRWETDWIMDLKRVQ